MKTSSVVSFLFFVLLVSQLAVAEAGVEAEEDSPGFWGRFPRFGFGRGNSTDEVEDGGCTPPRGLFALGLAAVGLGRTGCERNATQLAIDFNFPPSNTPYMMDVNKAQVWHDGTLIDITEQSVGRFDKSEFIPEMKTFLPASGRTNDQLFTLDVYTPKYLTDAALEPDYEEPRLWATKDSFDSRGKYGYSQRTVRLPDQYLGTSLGVDFADTTTFYYPYDMDDENHACEKSAGCAPRLGTPEKEEGFSVIVFAYGGADVNEGGQGCARHENLMKHFVTHGFVVCCPPLDMTGETSAGCARYLSEQNIKTNSMFYGKISNAMGVAGWSSGGARAINAVAHPEGRQYFSALVALAPCTKACLTFNNIPTNTCVRDKDNGEVNANYYLTPGELDAGTARDGGPFGGFSDPFLALERTKKGACPTNDRYVKVPTLYATGANDYASAPPAGVRAKFDRGDFPGVMVTRTAGPLAWHPAGGSQFWAGEATAFFKLHLDGDLNVAPFIWGQEQDKSLAGFRGNAVYHRPGNTGWIDIANEVSRVTEVLKEAEPQQEEEAAVSN